MHHHSSPFTFCLHYYFCHRFVSDTRLCGLPRNITSDLAFFFFCVCSGGSRNILIHVELQAMRKQESAEWTETLGCGGGWGRICGVSVHRPIFVVVPVLVWDCIHLTFCGRCAESPTLSLTPSLSSGVHFCNLVE